MSAFVVSDDCMQRAVAGLVAARIVAHDEADETGAALWRLNAEAIRQRYPRDPEMLREAEQAEFTSRTWRWSPIFPKDRAGRVAALKALHCLRYQCAEGDISDATELGYKLLGRAISNLANLIVRELPEYDAVPWDS